jgi:hypothetical protein
MVHMMHLWISGMNYMLFACFPEFQNADCVSPSFNFDQADAEFLLELHLVF